MINFHYFNQRFDLQYSIELESHNLCHLNSKITIKPKYNIKIENNNITSIFNQIDMIYA